MTLLTITLQKSGKHINRNNILISMKPLSLIIIFILLLLFITSCSPKDSNYDINGNLIDTNTNIAPEDTMTNTIIVMETNMGTMKIKLYDDKAPITTGNFKKLVKDGFYDSLIFHRIISDFMIQGGDPDGKGTGGPGYEIKDEFHKDLRHSKKGILSMANSGPNTGGSQFFITLVATPWLDNHHSVFGEVVEGLDVLDKIGKVKTGANDKPVKDVVMEKVYIQ